MMVATGGKPGMGRGSSLTGPQGERFFARLASVHLTLWLLGILMLAMALGTLLPQKAPAETYLRLFGALLGPLLAQTTLTDVFGAWWFAATFALLALNLLACASSRTRHLLRTRPHPWPAYAPVLMHFGVVLVLAGAGWGHLPGRAYREIVLLEEGKITPLEIGGERFGLRLAGAGLEQDAKGNPSDYWASVEVVREGHAGPRRRIQSNHPLRYHHISAVLQSLTPATYDVEVQAGGTRVRLPVVRRESGAVEVAQSYAVLPARTLVIVQAWREPKGGTPPAAFVALGRVSKGGPSFQAVGWVEAQGTARFGKRFRLVPVGSRAEVMLDRDVGLPIVFTGLVVLALGAVLSLPGPGRRGEAPG